MAQSADLYDLLGVSREASADEIKKAYRRLAREHHPDVSDAADDGEHFKQVVAAYEILSDPAKRRQYDMFGEQGGRMQSPFGDVMDISAIFDAFFGGGGGGGARRRGPQGRTHRGEGLPATLELSFEEASFGVAKEIRVDALTACDRCGGNGCEPGTAPTRCRRCGGSGELQEMQRSIFGTVMTAHPCVSCRGTGEEILDPCSECNGDGRVARERVVSVEVPAGVADGLELRVTGAGHDGRAGGPPGDLYVAIQVEPHKTFERRGQDLFSVLELPMTQAALGVEVEFETLDSTERLKLAAGIESGTTLRIRGAGVPNLGRRGRGDLFVTVEVITPEPESKDERRLLEQLAGLRGETPDQGKIATGRLAKPGEDA